METFPYVANEAAKGTSTQNITQRANHTFIDLLSFKLPLRKEEELSLKNGSLV